MYLPFFKSSLCQNFVNRFAAKSCYFFRTLQALQSFHCSQNYVLFVVRSQRFCTDVFDTSHFQYVTCRTTGDNSGTFRGSLQQYGSTAEFSCIIMWNTCIFIQVNFDQFLCCILFSFADRFRNFSCFTQTCSNVSIAVTYNY